MQLVDCDFSVTVTAEFLNKHVLSYISVHTDRHNCICLLMIDGHVCTYEWINKCNACSLVLTHINRIINFARVWFSVQKKPSAQIKERLWDQLGSRVTNRPKPSGLIRLTLVCWGRQHRAWQGHTTQSLQLLTHMAKDFWPVFHHLQNSLSCGHVAPPLGGIGP